MSPLLDRLTAAATKRPEDADADERLWLSRDPIKVQEFKDDPLCGFDYPAGGYSTMLHYYHFMISKKWGRTIPNIPILIIAGTEDTASDFGNGPRAYNSQLIATGHTKVDLELLPDCRHEIIQEINRAEIFTYICDWFKSAVS
jgi:alpha-beta hydrolase superfamily lysophospholipase